MGPAPHSTRILGFSALCSARCADWSDVIRKKLHNAGSPLSFHDPSHLQRILWGRNLANAFPHGRPRISRLAGVEQGHGCEIQASSTFKLDVTTRLSVRGPKYSRTEILSNSVHTALRIAFEISRKTVCAISHQAIDSTPSELEICCIRRVSSVQPRPSCPESLQ
jgi:hypothetical protein